MQINLVFRLNLLSDQDFIDVFSLSAHSFTQNTRSLRSILDFSILESLKRFNFHSHTHPGYNVLFLRDLGNLI